MLKELINENTIHGWDGLKDYKTIMKELEEGSRLENFGSNTRVPILGTHEPRITIEQLFEDYLYGMVYVDEMDELLEMGVYWEHVERFNTYNYSSPIERDLLINLYKSDLGDYVATVNVHIGLDARNGFSNSFMISLQDDYEILELLGQSFTLVHGTYEDYTGEYDFSISGSAISDILSFEDDLGNYEEAYMDFYDYETLEDEVKSFLELEIIGDDDITVKLNNHH